MNFKKPISMLLALACAFTFLIATPGINLSALTTSEAGAVASETADNSKALPAGMASESFISDEVIQQGGFPKKSSNYSTLKNGSTQQYLGINTALQSMLSSAWSSYKTTIDVSSLNIPRSEFGNAYFAVLNANPQFFYVKGEVKWNYYIATETVAEVTIYYAYPTSQIPSMVSQFNTNTNKILSMVNSSWSDVEKALFVHDYFATNCEYDEPLTKYDAYNVIVERTAVCQGYALAFQHIMNKLNIPCKVVTSDAINHAWNTVYVNGNWYYLDITWDDPVPDTLGYSRHTNFLKSESFFRGSQSDHGGADWIVDGASAMGKVTNTAYDSFFWDDFCGAIPSIGRRWYYYNYNNVLCYYDFSAKKSVSLTSVNDKWYVWGSTSQSYPVRLVSKIVTIGDRVYYSTPKSIMSVNSNGTDSRVEYTLTSSQAALGYIYSIEKSGNSIRYYVQQGPTGAVKTSGTYTPSSSAVPAKPVVKATAGDGSVTLTWNKVSGATEYSVFQYANGTYTRLANTSATSYTKTGLKNGATYQFLVRAYNNYGGSSFTTADLVSAMPVAIPAKPVVKVINGNEQVTLTWNKVNNATSYAVFQYANGTYTRLVNTSATSFTKTGLKNGTTYQFLVRAFNNYGGNPFSTADLVSAKPIFSLAKPVVNATAGDGSVTLTWNKVSGATSYAIFQYANGTYTRIANTYVTSYTKTGLKNGTTYQFLVRAYNSNGGSSFSTADLVSAKPIALLAKPNVTATTGNGSVTLSWNKISGATSYAVFQYANGTYTRIANTTATSYTKTGLKNNVTYQFLVRAYNNNGGSPFSTADIISVKPISLPAKPIVKATAGNTSITLSWNKVSGATSYAVFQYVNGTYIRIANTASTSFTKTGFKNGQNYQFLVRAYNSYGGSPFSTADLVTVKPFAPLAKPIVAATTGNRSVTLSWNKVSGATSYAIFQYVNGTYTRIATLSGTSTSFTQSGLNNGQMYQFLVRAYNSNGGNPFSTADLVTVKPMA